MALYEYRCSDCGDEFEQRRPMSEADSPAECPECGKEAARLPSVFASKDGYTCGCRAPGLSAPDNRPGLKRTPGSRAAWSASRSLR